MSTRQRATKTSTGRKGRGRPPKVPRRARAEIEKVRSGPLEPELPINPDAPLDALDPDTLEVLRDTQQVADDESDPTVDHGAIVDKERGVLLAGGDVDTDWDHTDVGDETVGGSTPTPDQDVVDDLGRAAGVTYSDAEPLRPEEKISERDQRRWEVDPASSQDYKDRLDDLRGWERRRKKRP